MWPIGLFMTRSRHRLCVAAVETSRPPSVDLWAERNPHPGVKRSLAVFKRLNQRIGSDE
jgi:hypothetical protein